MGQDKDSLVSERKENGNKTPELNKWCKRNSLSPVYRCSVGAQAMATSEKLPLSFIDKCDITWYGISHCSMQVSCLSSVTSHSLAHPEPTCCGGRVTGQVLTLHKHQSVRAEEN